MWAGFTLTYAHHSLWAMRSRRVLAIDQSLELVATLAQAAILTSM